MSKQSSSNVHVHYDAEELDPLSPEHNFFLKEFKQYKIDSLSISTNNFVAPNEGIQETTPTCHNLFGRDRVFEHPIDLINDIHRENLAHVHLSDGTWDTTRPQWECTSNFAIVYSGYTVGTYDYHFVVHEILHDDIDASFDAHDSYTRDGIEYYIANARYLKEQLKNS
ncbi:type II toxin-antitoxin system YafO family toxin [Vibrio fluvialis]|nr:type II toxin-antitoxin system YafO family toxin [Vibrio fluvialis]